MSTRIAFGVLLLTVAVLFSVATMQRYRILDTHGLELYWSSNQGYLIVRKNRLGWELTRTQVLKGYVRELLGSPIPVSRTRRSLTVLWFTKDAAETQTYDGLMADRFKIVEGTLFVDSGRKWMHASLEPTTPEEAKLYKSTAGSPVPEYSNFNGWSYRCCRGPEDPRVARVPFVFDGVPVDLIVQSERGGDKTFVLKRGEQVTPVLTLNDETRSVSRDEYIQLMGPEGK